MAQTSYPLAGAQFTDAAWRDLFGDEPGVVGDMDGSAYAVALSSGSDVAQIGSATQASLARVAGFAHRISAASTEPITIPVASGSARTDIIALRYDPANTGAPGPVRLVRIAGTSASLPAFDQSPPGVEDLPLWGVTRQPSQALSAATVQRLFPRLAPALELPVGAPLPTSSPLGTRLRQGPVDYMRVLGTSGVPVWSSTASNLTANGRQPITTTTKVATATALTPVITVPAVTSPCTVVFTALGRSGFDDTSQKVSWDWVGIPVGATSVAQDDPLIQVTAGASQWTTVVSSLVMDVPAGTAAAAQLRLRSTGPVYSRGAVIWHREPKS